MRRDYEGKHVLVTGAGGALGAAVAVRLGRRGAICHLVDREEAFAAPAGVAPETAHLVRGIDLTDEASVIRLYDALPSLWASIHCAGGFSMSGVTETSRDDLEAMWRINVLTCFLCCREAARVLRAAGGGGRIVNVSARPGLEPRSGAGMTAYTASKAAVAAFTQAMGEELAAESIWVNAVAPSILDTEANRRAMPDADPSLWASTDAVAETIAYLASPENGATRSAVVPVYARV